jgi:hypothetical protein
MLFRGQQLKRSLTGENPVSNVRSIALKLCGFIFFSLKKSPSIPLCSKGGICPTREFPLFEKEGLGEILDKSEKGY